MKGVINMYAKKYFIEDWKGKKFNHLTIEDYQDKLFVCRCDCGRICSVKPTFVINGKQKTCGNAECEYHHEIFIEIPRQKATKHGMAGTRLYKIWQAMKDRCLNEKNTGYKNYGGRGITVCKEWQDSFAPFMEWATANGYDDTLTIDRIDVNGNYEPGNCRWADWKTQRQNQRPRKDALHCIDGECKTSREWEDEYGVSEQLVSYYRCRYGYSFEEALKVAKQKNNIKNKNKRRNAILELAGIPEEEQYKYFVMKGKVYKYRAYED